MSQASFLEKLKQTPEAIAFTDPLPPLKTTILLLQPHFRTVLKSMLQEKIPVLANYLLLPNYKT